MSVNPNNLEAALAALDAERDRLIAAKARQEEEARKAAEAEAAKKAEEARRKKAAEEAAKKGKGSDKVGEGSGSVRKGPEWRENPEKGVCPRCAHRGVACEWPVGGRGKSCKLCS